MPGLPEFLILLAICALSVDPDEHAGDKRPPLFTISPETTVIDGPLTRHGTIDYIAYLNKQLSEGVTIENNAVVLMSEAFGPEIVDKSVREATFDTLGIPVPPADGDYLIRFDDFIKERYGEAVAEMKDRVGTEMGVALGRPWTAEEFPNLNDWIESNARPLEIVQEASLRERHFLPLICPQGNFLYFTDVLHTNYHFVRDSSRLLTLRATRRLASGDINGAWEDLTCILRLARLIDDGKSAYSRLIAIAIFGDVFQAMPAMLASPLLDEARAARFHGEFAQWKGIDALSSGWEEFHRMECLNCLQEYAAGTLSLREIVREFPYHGTEFEVEVRAQSRFGRRIEFVQRVFANLFTDWDAAALLVNRWYDRCGEAFSQENAQLRQVLMESMDKEFDPLMERYWFAGGWEYAIDRFIYRQITRRMRGEDLGGMLLAEMSSPLYAEQSHSRYEAKRCLTLVGLALAAYHAGHDEYPAELSALVPDYLGHVPRDPYTNEPLVFEPAGDEYLLYSLGPNFMDDDGVDIRENNDEHDIVLRVSHSTD